MNHGSVDRAGTREDMGRETDKIKQWEVIWKDDRLAGRCFWRKKEM